MLWPSTCRRASPTPTRPRARCSRSGSPRERWRATQSPRCGRIRRTTPDPTGSGAPAAASSAGFASKTTARAGSAPMSAPTPAPRRIACGSPAPRAATAPPPSPPTPTDRLLPPRATAATVPPIFSLYSDPEQAAWRALAPATAREPWGEVSDSDGTVHRLWRVADPEAIAAVQAATAGAELLIADGHHRYETMHAYAEEVGGEGEHRYILMCLVALEDPGLTVFPTHRLVNGLDQARREALEAVLQRDYEIAEVPLAEIAPPPGTGPLTLGYIDSSGRLLRLTLRDQAIADAAIADHSEAYRLLHTGVLETLLLKGALGLGDEDIAHFNGLFYARDTDEALTMVASGAHDAAFLMRPTPVEQVRAVAAEGENMPPKSTYFFPKLLTGLLFNPLA